MKQKTKLQQQSTEQHQQTERTFDTPEDLLRYDAARTELPDKIADRLAESMAATPQPWWRRWLKQSK